MTSPLPEDRNRATEEAFLQSLLTLGFAFAVVAGLLYLSGRFASFGFTMVFGIPLLGGMIIGHTDYRGRAWKIAAALAILATVLLTLFMLKVMGPVCTVIAGLVLLVPITVGSMLGHYIQVRLRKKQPQTHPIGMLCVFIAIVTFALYFEPRLRPSAPIESVTTTRLLDLDSKSAWESVVFYEDVGLEPPLLTRIGLPYPVGTEGESHRVGSLTRCIYSSGYLVKRITEVDAERRLAFDVIEQQGVEDRSFELVSGSFEFEAVGEKQTRVVLRTDYRPLLQARFYWRPFEERLAHTLHDYVLDAMSAQEPSREWVASR